MEEQEPFTIYLTGRYYAALTMLPMLVVFVVLFFLAAFFLAWIIFADAAKAGSIILLPFVLGSVMLAPVVACMIFIIKWHAKRHIDCESDGITMMNPKGRGVFVPWDQVYAVELRYSKPNTLHCTLVTPHLRFTFSNIEMNLQRPCRIQDLPTQGFAVEKFREFLYYLKKKSPNLKWRMGQSFKSKYKIHYPPYDLEKLK